MVPQNHASYHLEWLILILCFYAEWDIGLLAPLCLLDSQPKIFTGLSHCQFRPCQNQDRKETANDRKNSRDNGCKWTFIHVFTYYMCSGWHEEIRHEYVASANFIFRYSALSDFFTRRHTATPAYSVVKQWLRLVAGLRQRAINGLQ